MPTFLFVLVIAAQGQEAVALPVANMETCLQLKATADKWLPDMVSVQIKAFAAECGQLKPMTEPT